MERHGELRTGTWSVLHGQMMAFGVSLLFGLSSLQSTPVLTNSPSMELNGRRSYQMRFDASRIHWLFRLLNARCQSQLLFASVFTLQKMAVQVNVIYFPRVSTYLTINYIIFYL